MAQFLLSVFGSKWLLVPLPALKSSGLNCPLVAFDEAVVVAINTESKYRWMAFMWREITVMTDQ